MPLTCCEFYAPAIGDAAAVIVIRTGDGAEVTGLVVYAEGCDEGYVDAYDDTYGMAGTTDTSYTISDLPANSTLTIDAVSETVTLTDDTGLVQLGGIDHLDWLNFFEWITATNKVCMSVCVDDSDASTNANTTVEISVYEREW